MKISHYIKSTPAFLAVTGPYIAPELFLELYFELDQEDADTLLRHVMLNNTPFAFKDKPLIFEKIKEYLSDALSLQYHEILLIGSAKTGYSFAPNSYGRAFSGRSDFDFTIISQSLFERLKDDFVYWKKKYQTEKSVLPRTEREKKYWDDNIVNVSATCNRGFIDTYKLPNRDCCGTAKKVNDALYNVMFRLNQVADIKNSKASARVYRDNEAFARQLRLNTSRLVVL